MAETTIEWTRGPNGEQGFTFNPWIGCTKVSPGCDHCYAARQDAHRRWTPEGWGGPRRRTKTWGDPLKWNAQAEREGRRYRVFCASLADVFDNQVPDEWRRDLFKLIDECRRLDWLLLTKRIGNAARMIADAGGWTTTPWPNVWLGATVVNQEEADRDIPKLLAVPARVRFLSIEPMLGPVDLTNVAPPFVEGREWHGIDVLTPHNRSLRPCLDWIIAGGESGPQARPAHPDWFRSLRDQCAAAGVAFMLKQWGEWAPVATSPVHPEATRIPGNLCRVTRDGVTADHYVAISTNGGRQRYELRRIGKKAAGRLLDGQTHDGFPEVR